jgi:hypothetical protein
VAPCLVSRGKAAEAARSPPNQIVEAVWNMGQPEGGECQSVMMIFHSVELVQSAWQNK